LCRFINEETARVVTVTSDSDGNFVVPQLLSGTYTLVVTASGFKRFEQKGIILTANDCVAVRRITTVLGIDSAGPGFSRVSIRPHLGKLTQTSGSIPHPKGEIAMSLKLVSGKLKAEVSLPHDVSGEIVWRGTRRPLNAGLNKLSF
jgi:Carboxypeptidase regulatory-like domain/Bacterial alpha-L-rhamnosidase C-terminal domain